MVQSLYGVKSPTELPTVESVATDVVARCCIPVRASQVVDFRLSGRHVQLHHSLRIKPVEAKNNSRFG